MQPHGMIYAARPHGLWSCTPPRLAHARPPPYAALVRLTPTDRAATSLCSAVYCFCITWRGWFAMRGVTKYPKVVSRRKKQQASQQKARNAPLGPCSRGQRRGGLCHLLGVLRENCKVVGARRLARHRGYVLDLGERGASALEGTQSTRGGSARVRGKERGPGRERGRPKEFTLLLLLLPNFGSFLLLALRSPWGGPLSTSPWG